MRLFYTSIGQLPEDSAEYFTHYHILWFSKELPATSYDLESGLKELRLAYKKYPEARGRIKDMALVLNSGIAGFQRKEVQAKQPSSDSFSEEVKDSLF